MNVEKIDQNTTEDELLKILDKWLIKNEYIVRIPQDISVLFNKEKAGKLSKLIYRNEEDIAQMQQTINILTIEKQQLEQSMAQIVNSRTWKGTEFIRKINAKLHKNSK